MRKNDGDWFPLSSDYPTHRKTFHLCRLLGPAADAYPVRLMAWLRDQENTDGTFADEGEVEQAARWPGDPGKLIAALRSAGILDGLTYHNWAVKGGKHIVKMFEARKRTEDWKKQYGTHTEPIQSENGTSKRKKEKEKERENKKEKDRESENPKDSCSEASSEPESVPIPQELVGLALYECDNKLKLSWAKLYPALKTAHPGIDVAAETRKAHAWEIGNPERVKKNRPKFLTGWMGRAQDNFKGNGNGPVRTNAPKATATAAPSDWSDPSKGGKRDF